LRDVRFATERGLTQTKVKAPKFVLSVKRKWTGLKYGADTLDTHLRVSHGRLA